MAGRGVRSREVGMRKRMAVEERKKEGRKKEGGGNQGRGEQYGKGKSG